MKHNFDEMKAQPKKTPMEKFQDQMLFFILASNVMIFFLFQHCDSKEGYSHRVHTSEVFQGWTLPH